MKSILKPNLTIALLCALFSAGGPVLAQGTAFTYQGRLSDSGKPATGSYDLLFLVYDVRFAGSQLGPAVTNSPTVVSNGLFTATLDFGQGVFTGGARWLEIWVRTNGAPEFVALTPRQELTPAPYAITAANAAAAATVTGTVPASQ
jgi:hypothetical protein